MNEATPVQESVILPLPESKCVIWTRVADGVWKNKNYKKGTLYERPKINGKWTFKSLNKTSIKYAKEELRHRLDARAKGIEPTERPLTVAAEKAATPGGVTAGDVIRFYQEAGYPDKQTNQRPESTLRMEKSCCANLLKFWEKIPATEVNDVTCDNYKFWRTENMTRDSEGTRMVDLDLNSLNNAFRFGKRKGIIQDNPLRDRPRFHSSKNVKHCREFMPADVDELHERASQLFKHQKSAVFGFQYLFEAYTGLRSFEVLHLGDDGFGTLTPDGKYMRVWRAKNQHHVNPYVEVHEGLKELLEAHSKWKATLKKKCNWFFPGRDGDNCVGRESLAHALDALPGKKVTSHGARAFFVTVRRSWGKSDAQIAFEVGQTTGGATIAKVYGGVPENWRDGDGPKLAWLPKGQRAWATKFEFGLNGHEIQTNQASKSATK